MLPWGNVKGAITRQSHPICRGYEGEFVCFNSDRSNLYCGGSSDEKKKKKKTHRVFRITVWEPIENLMD